MGKHAKKKTNRDGQAEVLTGHDEKAERESPDRRLWSASLTAPTAQAGTTAENRRDAAAFASRLYLLM